MKRRHLALSDDPQAPCSYTAGQDSVSLCWSLMRSAHLNTEEQEVHEYTFRIIVLHSCTHPSKKKLYDINVIELD